MLANHTNNALKILYIITYIQSISKYTDIAKLLVVHKLN